MLIDKLEWIRCVSIIKLLIKVIKVDYNNYYYKLA